LPSFSFTTPSLTENWFPQTVRWFICPVFTSLATFPLQAGQMYTYAFSFTTIHNDGCGEHAHVTNPPLRRGRRHQGASPFYIYIYINLFLLPLNI
jgi:hypothetical protein